MGSKGVTTYYGDSRMFHGNVPSIMGTRFDMIVVGKPADEMDRIWTECVTCLERIDVLANRFSADSEVSRLNRSEPLSRVWVTDEMCHILRECDRYRSLTQGYFDVTLGRTPFPAVENDGSIAISNCGCYVDLGGFAKGYGLDRVSRILKANDVESAYVDFGGSAIMAIGTHPHGDSWMVSIPDPYTSRELKQFSIKDCAMSVSGNTPRYNTHIVDPHTGACETRKKLAVIVATDPLDAEVLSTTWMVAGEESRREIVKNFDIKSDFVFLDASSL